MGYTVAEESVELDDKIREEAIVELGAKSGGYAVRKAKENGA